jgi:hypothetical protein
MLRGTFDACFNYRTALRQRMLEDMAMLGLRSDTQHDYIRLVRSFAAFLGRSPDKATAEISAGFAMRPLSP